MNVIIIDGGITSEAKLNVYGNTKVCKFTVAVNREFKDDGTKVSDFIPVTAFGKNAEVISQYGAKGVRVLVKGRLQVSKYKNKDGVNCTSTDVIADKFEFLSPVKKKNDLFAEAEPSDEMPF